MRLPSRSRFTVIGTTAWAAADPMQAHSPSMQFVPPAPGTYRLQRIQRAPDALLRDARDRPRRLGTLTRGKVTLLTFFYTYCVDEWGCPFAYRTMVEPARSPDRARSCGPRAFRQHQL